VPANAFVQQSANETHGSSDAPPVTTDTSRANQVAYAAAVADVSKKRSLGTAPFVVPLAVSSSRQI
jgi:hypothetical protein